MEFYELLNKYCNEADCTNQELADFSGLSKSLIGRYKNGQRTPDINGTSLKSLADGLTRAYEIKKIDCNTDEIFEALRNCVISMQQDKSEKSRNFSSNLNYCMELLSISNADLARFIHVDSSMISRIRREQRQISEIDTLSMKCAQYVFANCMKQNSATILDMLSCDPSDIESEQAFVDAFTLWLQDNTLGNRSDISGFLDKLDAFDLNEYIKAIKFDDLKVPTMPITIPTSKKYYGIDGMRQGTLDFLKATALGNKNRDVCLYNDLSMTELAEDMEFGKKWMFGLAAILKKGLHIHTIHCLDRPFHELMLGLESWIPLYMTGQISPYYLKGRHNSVFCKAQWCSGSAVLTGECISGHIEDGMYALSKKESDINYGIRRADNLLSKAHPLMNVYRREDESKFFTAIHNIESQQLNRKGILCCPPLYTMSEGLLETIMQRNGLPEERASLIMQRAAKYRAQTMSHLKDRRISDFLSVACEESFREAPVKLHLANINVEESITYSYEEYVKHIEETKAFAADNPGYSLELTEIRPFDNIQIFIYGNKTVCLSKNNPPVINFIIKYPKLVEAFEDMMLPVL